jgi:hypothetical protein
MCSKRDGQLVHIDRGSMQVVQHQVIYSPERNQLLHNGLRCLIIIYLNTILSRCTHNVLILLDADSASLRLKLAWHILQSCFLHLCWVSTAVPTLTKRQGLSPPAPLPPLPPILDRVREVLDLGNSSKYYRAQYDHIWTTEVSRWGWGLPHLTPQVFIYVQSFLCWVLYHSMFSHSTFGLSTLDHIRCWDCIRRKGHFQCLVFSTFSLSRFSPSMFSNLTFSLLASSNGIFQKMEILLFRGGDVTSYTRFYVGCTNRGHFSFIFTPHSSGGLLEQRLFPDPSSSTSET